MKNCKKHLEITGSLIFPIEVGMAAFIQEGAMIRRTSRVLSVDKLSPSEIQFETRNTNYLLHLLPNHVNMEAAV